MLLGLRMLSILGLLVLAARLYINGFAIGFGQGNDDTSFADDLFVLAGLSSLILIFILIKFRKSSHILLISIFIYLVFLFASTLVASYLAAGNSTLSPGLGFEKWLHTSPYILTVSAFLAPIPILTSYKSQR